MPTTLIEHLPAGSFYVSEPDPRMFGNAENIVSPDWTNENWLKSRFHFNFAESRSGANNFGVLRVLNDDLVQPSRGFGTHGHSNMEIATFVLEGELTHKDSMGNEESLGRGSVQFMSAGRGVHHSEFNKSPNKPLRFLQIWIVPAAMNLEPNYGSLVGDDQCAQRRRNRFDHVIAPWENKTASTPVRLHQDVNFHLAELDPGVTVDFSLSAGRQAYAVAAEGTVAVTAQSKQGDDSESVGMTHGDGARLFGPSEFKMTAAKDTPALFLIIEMKESK